MVVIIDNYDSFTYNIVQYLLELGFHVEVAKNDRISLQAIRDLNPNSILISPGPGTPDDSGICLDAIKAFSNVIPIFGVCLGHQCIAQVCGANIINASEIVHGKTSKVHHDRKGIYLNLPESTFLATRYHSLVVDKLNIPNSLIISSWTENETGQIDEIMGIRHVEFPLEGVQFHPESILSQYGHDLINNFFSRYC